MATIVCFRTGDVKPVGSVDYRIYDIVDGQQRLTTLLLLLKAIEKVLNEGDEKKDIGKILVKGDGHLLLLQTNNANQRLLNQYLREGTEPEKEQIQTQADRNLKQAIQDCEGFVLGWTENGREVVGLLRLLRNRLGFVAYDTDDNSIVYSVFEVLNSRGLAVVALRGFHDSPEKALKQETTGYSSGSARCAATYSASGSSLISESMAIASSSDRDALLRIRFGRVMSSHARARVFSDCLCCAGGHRKSSAAFGG